MEEELRKAVALIEVIDDKLGRMPLSSDQVDTADTIMVLIGMLKDVVSNLSDELYDRKTLRKNIAR